MIQVIIAVLLAAYSVVCLWFFIRQREFIYRPSPDVLSLPECEIAGLQEVETRTFDGLRLSAWFVPPADSTAYIFVFLHGAGGTIEQFVGRAKFVSGWGCGVLLPEYRGFGGNPGRPSERGLLADVRAAFDFLTSQGIDEGRVIVSGTSLGTGVATQIAAERPVAALLLESPFTSLVDVAFHHYPLLPVHLLMLDRFSSNRAMAAVRVPVLILLGLRDTVVPPRLGQRLFRAANQPKEIWISPEGGHRNLVGSEAADAIVSFLMRHLPDFHPLSKRLAGA